MVETFRSLFAPPGHLLLLLAALWIGLYLSEKRIERHGVSKDALNNLVFYSSIGYVIGGRFLFALANLSAFTESPLNILSVNVGLFDPVGALIAALLVGFVYRRRQKLHLWVMLDALTHYSQRWRLDCLFCILRQGQPLEAPQLCPGPSHFGMQVVIRPRFMNSSHRFLSLD
jgi:hypothetical protein